MAAGRRLRAPQSPAASAADGVEAMDASRRAIVMAGGAAACGIGGLSVVAPARAASLQSWPLNARERTGIHDVAPAPDGGVWFSAQRSGHLGWFDPKSGRTELVSLGPGSAPHGVIQGPDQAAWLTDGGQNAFLRVSWPVRHVLRYQLPEDTGYANLNTCAFDGDGQLWFTGQSGFVGKVALPSGQVTVKRAPDGRGPYGICATPHGDVWWCSLAGSFIARIDRRSGESQIVQPPTKRQGARRVWSDSHGRIWVSEWLSGQLSMHDPRTRAAEPMWKQWKLPGADPRAYAVYVDERDHVWVSDFSANAVLRFDPATERFESFAFPREGASVRQILGRPGEVWLPESGTEFISVIRTA
jgi:virginiamycin B lyase